MARGSHWMEQLRDALRLELSDISQVVKETLRETRPPPRAMSIRDRVAAFLGMPREQRLALAAQMGPERYRQWLDSHMTDLVTLVGPAARHLMPYFYSELPPESVDASLAGIMDLQWASPGSPELDYVSGVTPTEPQEEAYGE